MVAAIILLRSAPQRTYRIHMITDVTPLRVLLAEDLRAEGSLHHLDIVLESKHRGTLDALAEVDSPSDIKLALIPGGITDREYPHLRMVTTVAREPLHLLVRAELAEKGISGLRGKRVDLGPRDTASHHLAREVLAFVGLVPSTPSGPGGYTLESSSPDDLYRELGRIESLTGPDHVRAVAALPDAVMFLAPLPSLLAKRFVRGCRYELLPLPFAEAFCLDRLNAPDPDGVRVDRALLGRAEIPAYTYGSDPPQPAKAYRTISAPLLLIAEDDLEVDAVMHILETIYDSRLTNVICPPPLREQVHPFPLHPGTERYLRRNDPLLTTETASNYSKLAGGIGAFASGMMALYGFVRLRKLSRFESYYREVGRIERIARGLEVDPDAPANPEDLRAELELRLSNLKCQVLEDFAEGGVKGEGLLAGIIALINDTRDSLAGMLPQHGRPVPKSMLDEGK